ncbi:hypothetical protein K8I61_10600 [bacterium]|nr:hypothetical protein [bacterium]
MNSARAVIFFAAVALVAAACAPRPRAPSIGIDTEDLAEALKARAVPFSAFGTMRSGGLAIGYAEAKLLVDPVRGIRIDAFTPFMTPMGSIVLLPRYGQYLNRVERVLIQGEPAKILATLFALPVDPAPLPAILAGGLPAAHDGWDLVRPWPIDPPGAIMLAGRDAGGRWLRAAIEGGNRRLTSFASFREDDPTDLLAQITCSDHRDGPVPIPQKVVIRAPESGETLTLRLTQIEIGKGPTDADLRIAEDGVKVIDL